MDGIDYSGDSCPYVTLLSWEESGRWMSMSDELMRMHDRHDRQFALGPTHESMQTL